MKHYIEIMMESLNKKEAILEQLIHKSEKQKEIVSLNDAINVNWDLFDELVEQKGTLVEELMKLDEGFQTLFDRIKDELTDNKENYKNEIAIMQNKIRHITELSVDLETKEQRNKALVEKKFREGRTQIKQTRLGSQAAISYYNKMNKINTVDPQLMDRKS